MKHQHQFEHVSVVNYETQTQYIYECDCGHRLVYYYTVGEEPVIREYSAPVNHLSRVYRRTRVNLSYRDRKYTVYLRDPITETYSNESGEAASWLEARRFAAVARLLFAADIRGREVFGDRYIGVADVNGEIRAIADATTKN